MVTQITKVIKISVKTIFKGMRKSSSIDYYTFSYTITIENKSEETVQLTDRYWQIFDSLNEAETIQGEGVVGQTPTLVPNDVYSYNSGCFLASNIGAMKGFYSMVNIETNQKFKVIIPTFQLTTTALLN
jgi:ApaG protein